MRWEQKNNSTTETASTSEKGQNSQPNEVSDLNSIVELSPIETFTTTELQHKSKNLNSLDSLAKKFKDSYSAEKENNSISAQNSPKPQRPKQRPSPLTRKVSKQIKLDAFLTQESNSQTDLSNSIHNLSISDHDKNINSQDVMSVLNTQERGWSSKSQADCALEEFPSTSNFRNSTGGNSAQDRIDSECQTGPELNSHNPTEIRRLESEIDEVFTRICNSVQNENSTPPFEFNKFYVFSTTHNSCYSTEQDILVHTNIYGNSRCKKKKPPKCNRKNCRHCSRINKSGTVKSNSTGREYHSLVNVTCNSSNLIYMIECTICGIQYVGQTKNKILSRINQHYSSIKNLVDTPVSRHINSHSFEGFYPVRIYILTLIREDTDSIEGTENRNKWENYWMARLFTYVPKGLNIKD